MHTTAFHPVHPIHTACTAMLSTAITGLIFALVIVLPAEADTPPAAPALSMSLDAKTTISAAPIAPVGSSFLNRVTARPPSPTTSVYRERTAEGDVLEHRPLTSVATPTWSLETRAVLRHHDNRLTGDQRIGAPGVNYGPSRERSLQGSTGASATSFESFNFGYSKKSD